MSDDWLKQAHDDLVNKPDSGKSWHKYRSSVKRIAKEEGVDPQLVEAIIRAESSGNRLARSSAGASGLMQVMKPTADEVAKELGMKSYDLTKPEDNIRIGTRYIKNMLDRQDGNVELALASYNAGAGNVRKYGGVPPFPETQRYVKKVRSFYQEPRPQEYYDDSWLADINPDTKMPQGSYEEAPTLERTQ